jgi:poly(beta-D-mannuronate) lyase
MVGAGFGVIPAACVKTSDRAVVRVVRGASAAPLHSPFDVELRRKLVGTPMPEPAAAGPSVPPVKNLRGVSFYVDRNHSVADPELREENERAVRPVREYVSLVAGLADGWMRSSPADARYAALALDHLFLWASAGALLGATNRQGSYERTWTLGSLALSFLKLAGAPGIDESKLAVVRGWLSEVANEVIPEYDGANRASARNNHAYWAGLAVASAGVAANEPLLLDWGISRARLAISDVQKDGTLPLEMDRGSLALHYHAFALSPLVMLAEIAAANGIDLYSEGDGALRRLADRVIRGMEDPSTFEKLTGIRQDFPLATHPRHAYFAWAQAYYARFRDRRLLRWLASGQRPLVDARLGGDQTLAFGEPALPIWPSAR